MLEILSESLRQNADRPLLRVVESPGAIFVHEFTGADLAAASHLVERLNVEPDARAVLLLLPHCPELFLLQIGLVLSGKVPAVLPWPTTRVDGEKYQRNLLHQLETLPADHLVTLPRLADNLRPSLEFPVSGFPIGNHAQFERMFAAELEGAPARPGRSRCAAPLPDDAMFLQFSGGTTGTQKCVVVSEPMLRHQVERLSAALQPRPGDGVVSWLPLYHDMGLIACLYFPLCTGVPSLHFAASDWLLQPELLFRYLEQFHGTLCWLPNFAFSYLAQRRESMRDRHSAAHVRAWVNCSEPVRHRSLAEFAARFADWGVSPGCLHASYAMAENVFAITQSTRTPLRTVPRSSVTGSSLAYRSSAFEIVDEVYVSSGHCLDGMQVRIVAADGSECAERTAGEIHVRTGCMFQGYWSGRGFNRDSISADGWYRSGDFGFFDAAELFVIGRMKDIIIVAGQNIFPEDVELITAQVPGVYPGRVVAFGVENEELGTESIAVIAEMSGTYERGRASQLEAEIRRLIIASLGVAPRFVKVVQQRWIVKSTAGKISRRETRNRFLADERAGLEEVSNAARS